MNFLITILGSSSAIPTKNRNSSSQLIDIQGNLFLVDCGEGTQMMLKRLGKSIQRINHIFISHLHGDHFFGLFGLLSTMHMLGRKNPLHLYAHQALQLPLENILKTGNTELQYPLVFNKLPENDLTLLLDLKNIEVYTFPLKHGIPSNGFLFKEKWKELNIKKNIVETYQLTPDQIKLLKQGYNIEVNGQLLKSKEVTYRLYYPKSYAYCSDTMYDEMIASYVENVDCLYHEATFLSDMAEVAKNKFHATSMDAANTAKKANAKLLLLGHFSARYKNFAKFEEEAKTVFENVILVEDGQTYKL